MLSSSPFPGADSAAAATCLHGGQDFTGDLMADRTPMLLEQAKCHQALNRARGLFPHLGYFCSTQQRRWVSGGGKHGTDILLGFFFFCSLSKLNFIFSLSFHNTTRTKPVFSVIPFSPLLSQPHPEQQVVLMVPTPGNSWLLCKYCKFDSILLGLRQTEQNMKHKAREPSVMTPWDFVNQ